MNSSTRSITQVVLAIGVGLVTHSFGWGCITLALSAIIMEGFVAWWNWVDALE